MNGMLRFQRTVSVKSNPDFYTKVADAGAKALGNKAEPMGDQKPKRNAENCPNGDPNQNRPPIML